MKLKHYDEVEGIKAVLVSVQVRKPMMLYKNFLIPADSIVKDLIEYFYYFKKYPAKHKKIEKLQKNELLIVYNCSVEGYTRTKIILKKTTHLIYNNVHLSTAKYNADKSVSLKKFNTYNDLKKYL